MADRPDDETILVRRPGADGARAWQRRGGAGRWLAAGAGLAAACSLGLWSLSGTRADAPVPAAAAPAPAAPAEPPAPDPRSLAAAALAGAPVQVGDETAILAGRADRLAVYRFAPAPDILVLVFPTLHAQGLMLNRIGAMVEKAGLPHDRAPTEAVMSYVIAQSHVTADTYYSGHDYRTADLRRFFALAGEEGVPLRLEEETLRTLLDREECGAVISLAQDQDEAARATILRHELSHGLYFTSPGYAAYARRFWDRVLTEDERARFREFLAGQEYDPEDEDLMINETQAYLVHTADRRFFNAGAVQMTEAKVARLRAEFVRDMPQGWLRERTPGAQPAAGQRPVAR